MALVWSGTRGLLTKRYDFDTVKPTPAVQVRLTGRTVEDVQEAAEDMGVDLRATERGSTGAFGYGSFVLNGSV